MTMAYRLGVLAKRLAAHALLVILCLISAFPVYWMLKGSVEPTRDLLKAHLIPTRFTIQNYKELFESQFQGFLVNSVIVAVGTTVSSVVLATFAGYGLARFRFRAQKMMARSILFTYMFPSLAIAIPLFYIFDRIGLTNTRLGLIIADSSLILPFGIWLMWQTFQTVPRAYQESAYSLGASRLRTMLEIEVPLASPGIISIAILGFALAWEDYELSFILNTNVSAQTLTVGMDSFVEQDVIHWGLVESGGVFLAVPGLLIVLLLQRYLVKGIGTGGLKG